jgi:DNA invertase Pin-like site-specific DNA recombinase
LNGGNWTLVREFVEQESGKRNDRPQLREALHLARVTGSRLLIAKLDRLSRDAHFLLGLQKAGVRFTACDMPEATELTVGILALVAQNEREATSKRTKAAMAIVKAGIERDGSWTAKSGRVITRLGQARGDYYLAASGKRDPVKAAAAKSAKADAKAQDLAPIVADIRAGGIVSARGIARELQRRGILTPGGRSNWSPAQVGRIVARIGKPATG